MARLTLRGAARAAALVLGLALPGPLFADAPEGMIRVPGGTFLMGSDEHYAEEGPVREATVGAFWIDETEVTNARFAEFVEATGYVTVAERGLDPADHPRLPASLTRPGSMVFAPPREAVSLEDPTRWWRYIHGASWREPLGPGSSIRGFGGHPVVHVAYEDALAFAAWAGRDLPTEAEWEFAARGGLEGPASAWSEPYHPIEGWKANTWQGRFPARNRVEDGWLTTAPVGEYPANGYGARDMLGNVWEYVSDGWDPRGGRERAGGAATVKGGSWLCSPGFCLRWRPQARQPQERLLGSNHIGFRTVLRDGAAAD